MATLAQTECREVCYPEKCRSIQAHKKHKEKTLRDNPDVLYADYIQLNGKRIKNNFIFHTTMINAWKLTICEEYKHVFKEGIGRGGRLTICEDEMLDTDNPILTITYYTKGTFLLQGNEASLNSFEETFPLLKARVEKERDETHVNCTDSEEEGPVNPSPSDSLALLELDFTEFREHTQAKLSGTHDTNIYIQELKDELQQLKKNTSSSITELTRALRGLQEENRTLRLQLCKLEEDTEKKEVNFSSQLQEMKEQLQKTTKDDAPHNTAPDKPNYTNTECMPTTNTQTPAATQASPAQTPEPDPDVLLLMDSNGKFLDPKKLFPHQKVTAKRSSPRHLLPTPQYHRPIHHYMPRHPPLAPVRTDIAWTNTARRPPHPAMAPYTPVNLQSPTSHPPAAHQTPVRKKKPKTTPHQEKPPQPRAQSYAEAAAQPPAAPSTSTTASELSQIREMLQTLCNQLLNR
ncbi:hypothetical protein G5714_010585 [Onychostoma macrolepis]|uniref:Uncharacterized protein n=1 Tax=Onychostoma macrolepis TaxID=369639 RepID=A0A7J6CUZ4_9TELE|nr:hypothetical protein G5714_010585 [Onychostoma macrolepis]